MFMPSALGKCQLVALCDLLCGYSKGCLVLVVNLVDVHAKQASDAKSKM